MLTFWQYLHLKIAYVMQQEVVLHSIHLNWNFACSLMLYGAIIFLCAKEYREPIKQETPGKCLFCMGVIAFYGTFIQILTFAPGSSLTTADISAAQHTMNIAAGVMGGIFGAAALGTVIILIRIIVQEHRGKKNAVHAAV